MARLEWDKTGDRLYETGVKNAVLYLYDKLTKKYTNGVAWNGISSISESPEGAEENAIYADDMKYLSLRSVEEFGMTIEAYTYPDEWGQCDGSAEPIPGVKVGQQARALFGMCYRTAIGNDVDGAEHGYKLHLIYGATASPSERAYETINDSPEAINFSWEIDTTPVTVSRYNNVDYKPVSCITLDSTVLGDAKMKLIEDKLYGTETEVPTLPSPDELFALLAA